MKNMERGSIIVDRLLREALIGLRSQADLFSHLNDNLNIRKTELYSEYKDYV